MKNINFTLTVSATILFLSSSLFAWHDNTHMAIAKKAGIEKSYTVVGADITKIKFFPERENHWYDAERGEKITPGIVKEQIKRYDTSGDAKGHLLGAIVASFRKYIEKKSASKDTSYYLGFTAHYIGDMSNPGHLTVYDDYNDKHHQINDGIVENEVLDNLDKINVKKITIKSEEGLIKEIVNVAEATRQLGYKLRDENRDMTSKEAYTQLGLSVSLLQALIEYADTKK